MNMNSTPQFSRDDFLSADSDHVSRTMDALFTSGQASAILTGSGLAGALIHAVEEGNRTASGILLLGYCQDGAPVLKRLMAEHAEEPVKLKPWSRTVPLRIAATAALLRTGDAGARRTLLENVPDYDDSVRVFLLDIIAYLDAPAIWHQMSAYMSDRTEIPEGVPSGAARRRVCDHAVDAFLDLLDLPVSFERNPGGQYTDDNAAETIRLFVDTVPR